MSFHVVICLNRNRSWGNLYEYLKFMSQSWAIRHNNLLEIKIFNITIFYLLIAYLASITFIDHILSNLFFISIVWIFIRENISIVGVKEFLWYENVVPKSCLAFFDLFRENNSIGTHCNLDSFAFVWFIVMTGGFERESEER